MPVEKEKPPWWMDAIKTLGLPTVFLGVIVWMIWTAGSWAGNTVIIPIFNKQMEFINQASEMTSEMNRTTGLINKTLEAHGQHAIENLKTCRDTQTVVLETQGDVKAMRTSHDQIIKVLESIDENTKPLRNGGMPQ